jgi:hypothetical protein
MESFEEIRASVGQQAGLTQTQEAMMREAPEARAVPGPRDIWPSSPLIPGRKPWRMRRQS